MARSPKLPRSSKLKIFRTPIGFHDAYVAAPSQKAALEAWGTDSNLFARGEAELVTDAALTAEPLASPGKVVKKLRGTAAEQYAALPPDAPSGPKTKKAPPEKPKPAKSTPRPSRNSLDSAERAFAEAKERQSEQRKKFAEREAALARERRSLEQRQEDELDRLAHKLDAADAAYREAIRRWRG